jgi:hypothetical protein
MELTQIRPRLYRWTAPHPDYEPDAEPDSPADWPEHVGCVAYEAPDGLVLIDPLVPDALRPLLDLPIELVLVSHGEPVFSGGRDALERALA